MIKVFDQNVFKVTNFLRSGTFSIRIKNRLLYFFSFKLLKSSFEITETMKRLGKTPSQLGDDWNRSLLCNRVR